MVPWSSIIGNEEDFGKAGCREADVGVLKLVTTFSPVPWSSGRIGETSKVLVLFRNLPLPELRVRNFSGLEVPDWLSQ